MRAGAAVTLLLLATAGCFAADPPDTMPGLPEPRAEGADFTWAPPFPEVGEVVVFTALVDALPVGEGPPLTWAVDGDASAGVSPRLEHVFLRQGGHLVSMTVAGHATVSHVVTVTAARGGVDPVPDDPALPDGPVIRVTAHALGLSFSWSWTTQTAPSGVAWDFGDGNVSLQSEANHLYARPGRYQVTLTVGQDDLVRQASAVVDVVAPAPAFLLSSVAADAGEPTVGVTSSGCIFFQADQDVMRSCDGGASWDLVAGLLSAPNSSDPFLWVDPATDRVFSTNLQPNGECIWLAWSDDDGASWAGNPAACGPAPFADHQKLATGPRIGPLATAPGAAYPQAVYLCFNRFVVPAGVGMGIHCVTSGDGGATFPQLSVVKTGSGLHGNIKVGPDGSLFVPARTAPVTVHVSRDGALTWESHDVDGSAGVQDPSKDPDIAIDGQGHAFVAWVGADDRLRVARSDDTGRTWGPPVLAAPDVGAVAFPVVQAGHGKLAVAFLGSNDFRGNPGAAPPEARWDLYVAWAMEATAERPRFFVQQVTGDPVQVGPICMEGTCPDGSRNLLDFIGSTLDRDGRLLVSFADGCVAGCVDAPSAASSRSAWGTLAVALDGPALA